MNRTKRGTRPGRPRKPARSDRWSDIVCHALKALGGQAPLKAIYKIIERHPRTQGSDECNWRAKVRQTIQADDRYVRVAPGVWAFANRYSPQTVAKLRRLRRARYPRRSMRTA